MFRGIFLLSTFLFCCVSYAENFLYIEPYVTFFYTRTDAQSYRTNIQETLISQTNVGFGFHERYNLKSGWSILATEQLSQVQYYNDPSTSTNFRQTVYSDYNLGIGNADELVNIFQYSAHIGVKERVFFSADNFSTVGLDKFFVDYGGLTLYTRLYRGLTSRVGVGLGGDYLLGMHRTTYNVNDGTSYEGFLRWEKMFGNNLLHFQGGYQSISQNTNLNTLTEQNIYFQLLFSVLFP